MPRELCVSDATARRPLHVIDWSAGPSFPPFLSRVMHLNESAKLCAFTALLRDDRGFRIPFRDGTLSFAGSGRHSRGFELFLTLGRQRGLGKSPWETPFGRVVEGIETLHRIYSGVSAVA